VNCQQTNGDRRRVRQCDFKYVGDRSFSDDSTRAVVQRDLYIRQGTSETDYVNVNIVNDCVLLSHQRSEAGADG